MVTVVSGTDLWTKLMKLPVIAPLLLLLKSRKGIALIGLVTYEVILATTGQIEIAEATQSLLVLVLGYALSVAVEDAAMKITMKGRVPNYNA